MNKLDEMIRELCPNGVDRVKLGDVCSFHRGKTITAKNAIDAGIPVIAGGQKPSYFHNEYNREGETIAIAGSGAYAGFVSYWNRPIWLSDAFSVEPNNSLLHKYVYLYLKQNQKKIFEVQKGAGVPHVHGKDIENFEIPLPPLPIQQEIVSIMDKFTGHISHLNEALEQRQKQYEYYREKLLTFEDGECEWRAIGNIGRLVRGNGLQKRDFSEEGVGCIHYGQIYTRLGYSTDTVLSYVPVNLAEKLTKVDPGNLVVACTSENVEDVCKSVVWLGNETIVTGGHACVFKHEEDPQYIGHCFRSNNFFKQKRQFVYGAKVIDIKTESLAKIVLPIPSRERQHFIVATLDKFETHIAHLKEMIDLRQKQYEYYREKLLTF